MKRVQDITGTGIPSSMMWRGWMRIWEHSVQEAVVLRYLGLEQDRVGIYFWVGIRGTIWSYIRNIYLSPTGGLNISYFGNDLWHNVSFICGNWDVPASNVRLVGLYRESTVLTSPLISCSSIQLTILLKHGMALLDIHSFCLWKLTGHVNKWTDPYFCCNLMDFYLRQHLEQRSFPFSAIEVKGLKLGPIQLQFW